MISSRWATGASLLKRLHPGDQLLALNGHSLVNEEHAEAQRILSSVGPLATIALARPSAMHPLLESPFNANPSPAESELGSAQTNTPVPAPVLAKTSASPAHTVPSQLDRSVLLTFGKHAVDLGLHFRAGRLPSGAVVPIVSLHLLAFCPASFAPLWLLLPRRGTV
jgi:hypothetical protein